jgi:hypothetical protein
VVRLHAATCSADRGRTFIVAEVLHHLRRDLDGVPFDAVDARHVAVLHLREHVLQAVAELVEDRLHLAERHEAWRLAHGRRLVADDVGHRNALAALLLGAQQTAAVHARVHPSAAVLLLRPGVRVQEEPRNHLLVAFGAAHVEKAHVRVPHLGLAVRCFDRHAKQPRREREQPIQNLHSSTGKANVRCMPSIRR